MVTGDAIFTQKEICRVIRDRGGAYFFTVKDNQPALKADIALAFGDDSPLGRMTAHLKLLIAKLERDRFGQTSERSRRPRTVGTAAGGAGA